MKHKIFQVLKKALSLKHKHIQEVKANEPLQELNAIKKTIQLLLQLQVDERDSRIEYLTGINKSLRKEKQNILSHLEQLEGATTTEAEVKTAQKSRMELQERGEGYIQ